MTLFAHFQLGLILGLCVWCMAASMVFYTRFLGMGHYRIEWPGWALPLVGGGLGMLAQGLFWTLETVGLSDAMARGGAWTALSIACTGLLIQAHPPFFQRGWAYLYGALGGLLASLAFEYFLQNAGDASARVTAIGFLTLSLVPLAYAPPLPIRAPAGRCGSGDCCGGACLRETSIAEIVGIPESLGLPGPVPVAGRIGFDAMRARVSEDLDRFQSASALPRERSIIWPRRASKKSKRP